MTEIIPLSLWPAPTPEILTVLRAAKALIDTEVQVQPVTADLTALPGGPGTVLAFGVLPPFTADIILIREESTKDPERVAAALRHWLAGGAPTYTMADVLTLWMGAPVEQIIHEFDLGNAEHDFEMQKARLAS